MNNTIHFFDLDNTLWELENDSWIILKDKPNKPIIKINKLETKNILNGVYKKEENLIEFNGNMFWISDVLFDKIQKKHPDIDLSEFGLSFIEHINPDYKNKLNILLENVRHLFSKKDMDIGIISARFSVDNDKDILVSLKNEFTKFGLEINKFYYVSDYFKIKMSDKTSVDKMKVLLEHITGFHIKGDHFLPIKQDSYNEIHFYDDETQNINVTNNIQYYLEEYLKNSEDDVFNRIIEKIQNIKPRLYTHLISNNKLNRFKTTQINITEPIKYSIKVDESIKYFKNFK